LETILALSTDSFSFKPYWKNIKEAFVNSLVDTLKLRAVLFATCENSFISSTDLPVTTRMSFKDLFKS
jgi:hypothetical protein